MMKKIAKQKIHKIYLELLRIFKDFTSIPSHIHNWFCIMRIPDNFQEFLVMLAILVQ